MLAERGHTVIGLDLAPSMIAAARGKRSAVSSDASFVAGDAGDPPLTAHSVDVVLCRHVLWTLGTPERALDRWARLLRPGGRLVAIEGRWFEPKAHGTPGAPPWDGGVSADVLSHALVPLFQQVEHEPLSERADLWGRPVNDERYAMVARDRR